MNRFDTTFLPFDYCNNPVGQTYFIHYNQQVNQMTVNKKAFEFNNNCVVLSHANTINVFTSYLFKCIECENVHRIIKESFDPSRLLSLISYMSINVAKNTRRGAGNVCFVSPKMWSIIKNEIILNVGFTVNFDGDWKYLGMRFIVDEKMEGDKALVTYINENDNIDSVAQFVIRGSQDQHKATDHFSFKCDIRTPYQIIPNPDIHNYLQMLVLV